MQTKYFGQLDCPEEEMIRFPRGLFGFEEERAFFLLPFQGSGGSLLCFQSAVTPHLAFVAMNPAGTCASTPCAWCAARWRRAR